MSFISNLLFGDNSNKTSYRDAATQKAYSQITADTFDRQYGDMTDYLDKNYEGGSGAFKTNLLTGLEDNARNSLAQYKANKNNYFGDGLIGGILNPITQTVGGLGDLAALGLSGGKVNAWDGSKDYLGDKRDWLSDLGALGETALDVATMGTASGAKTLGKTMAKGALLGAGYGFAGGLRDMGTENFDLGQLAMNTGIGAGLGGGMAGAGHGLGKVWNKYSQPTPSKSTDIIPYSGGANTSSAAYQDALNTLKNAGIDTTSPETVNKSFRKFAVSNHPDKGGSTELFTKVNNAKTTYQDLLNNAGATATNAAPVANNLTFLQRLKNFGSNVPNMGKDLANTKAGSKVANLLKTKKGKIGAGIGGGLLLAQLMRNNNSNSGELSDEELQELYNYVYGGQ